MKVQEFTKLVRSRKPEYEHLDDTDLMQMVAQKKPELLKNVDRDDLALTMKQARAKKISQERQKVFKSQSGTSRFMAGFDNSVMDTFMGIHQALNWTDNKAKNLFGMKPNDQSELYDSYSAKKKEYKEESEGDVASGFGELAGALAVTSPIPGATGAKLAGKLAKPIVAAGVGGGYGASEFVDEDETRLKNTVYGAMFGAGGLYASKLLGKMGAKAYNTYKNKMKNAPLQDLMALEKKHNLQLSLGDITESPTLSKFETLSENVPGLGTTGLRETGSKSLKESSKGLKQKFALPEGADVGRTIKESVKKVRQKESSQATKNYNKVKELAGDATIKPNAMIKVAQTHADELSAGSLKKENPFTDAVEELKKSNLSFEDLRKERSAYGAKMSEAYKGGKDDLGRRYKEVRKAIDADIDELVYGKKRSAKDIEKLSKMEDEQYYQNLDYEQQMMDYQDWDNVLDSYGTDRGMIEDMAKYVKQYGSKMDKKTNMLVSEHIPASKFGSGSDEIATNIGMDESEFMSMLADMPIKPKKPKALSSQESLDMPAWVSGDLPKKEVMEAYKKAQKHYLKEVVPFKERDIRKIGSEVDLDKIYKRFIKKDNKDMAVRFHKALDADGKKAIKAQMVSDAVDGATDKKGYFSPAKFTTYWDKMEAPKSVFFKGNDAKEIEGYQKLLLHGDRFGQFAENPPTGNRVAQMLGAFSYTTVGIPLSAFVVRLMSTKAGKRLLLSSSKFEPGSKKMQKAIDLYKKNIAKTSAVTGKELGE